MTDVSIKKRFFKEITDYGVNAFYLSLFFSVFIAARRFTLEYYHIKVDDYFVGLIKALIFAKVIMIGGFLRISKNFSDKPLIIPVVYKTILFTGLIFVFDFTETFVKQVIHLQELENAYLHTYDELFNRLKLGGLMIVALSFLPFFALKELSAHFGEEKFRTLFFRNRKVKMNGAL